MEVLVLLGAVSLFFSDRFKFKEKLVLGIFLFISLLMYYWQPLFMVFSLLRMLQVTGIDTRMWDRCF